MISRFIPRGALSVLDADLHRLIAHKPQALGIGLLTSSLVAVWSASGGVKGLVDALNIAYDITETRVFVRLSLVAICFTGLGILISIIAIGLAVVLPVAFAASHMANYLNPLVPVLAWPFSFCISVLVLNTIYAIGSNQNAKWQFASLGSVFGTALWLGGTALFKWYVQNFGNFDQVYGSLGAIVGFLTWVWLSICIVLFGAELNREVERHKNASFRAVSTY